MCVFVCEKEREKERERRGKDLTPFVCMPPSMNALKLPMLARMIFNLMD